MYMQLVKGLNPEHLMSEFNNIAPKFVNPQIRWINALYIYGEEATPEWEKEEPEYIDGVHKSQHWTNRHCCECGHYNWKGGCSFCTRGLDHMTKACEHFDVHAEYEEQKKH